MATVKKQVRQVPEIVVKQKENAPYFLKYSLKRKRNLSSDKEEDKSLSSSILNNQVLPDQFVKSTSNQANKTRFAINQVGYMDASMVPEKKSKDEEAKQMEDLVQRLMLESQIKAQIRACI